MQDFPTQYVPPLKSTLLENTSPEIRRLIVRHSKVRRRNVRHLKSAASKHVARIYTP